jgi:hypothetical protein
MPHTPGPWYVNGSELIGDSTILATLCWHSGRDAENEADARLISAAPDLLRAAREAVIQIEYLHEKFKKTGSGESILRLIRAAIAKATGE